MSAPERFRLADYRPQAGASLRGLRARSRYGDSTAEQQLRDMLAKVEQAGDEGYWIVNAWELDILNAAKKFGLVVRTAAFDGPEMTAAFGRPKAGRWRWTLSPKGKAMVAGEELAEPAPLDADVVTDRMATKRRELAGRIST